MVISIVPGALATELSKRKPLQILGSLYEGHQALDVVVVRPLDGAAESRIKIQAELLQAPAIG